MSVFRAQTLAGNAVFDDYVADTSLEQHTSLLDKFAINVDSYAIASIVLAPPVGEPHLSEIDPFLAAAGFWKITTNATRYTLVMGFGVGVEFNDVASNAGDVLPTVEPYLSWSFADGSGTVARCFENPDYNATVDPADWVTTTYNNKRWPINEGTGALLNETETGDDTYDATIQNFIEGGWPD